MPQHSRLFFALQPGSDLQHELYRFAKSVNCAQNRRIITPEKIHMTLRYVGEVSDDIKGCLLSAITTDQCAPFTLTLNKTEYWKRQKLLLVSTDNIPQELVSLVQYLEQCCALCGIAAEERMFRPHITIIRNAIHLKNCQDPGPFSWPVNQFDLVESTTINNVTTYQQLKRWSLV